MNGRGGKNMISPKNYDVRGNMIAKGSAHSLVDGQDRKLVEALGRSMRLFLNLSFALIIAFPVFSLFDWQGIATVGAIVYLIPVATTIIFFIAFLRLLKRIEKYAAKKRNIELVSNIIWEFNKSSLIRLATGKIPTFTDEERGEKGIIK